MKLQSIHPNLIKTPRAEGPRSGRRRRLLIGVATLSLMSACGRGGGPASLRVATENDETAAAACASLRGPLTASMGGKIEFATGSVSSGRLSCAFDTPGAPDSELSQMNTVRFAIGMATGPDTPAEVSFEDHGSGYSDGQASVTVDGTSASLTWPEGLGFTDAKQAGELVTALARGFKADLPPGTAVAASAPEQTPTTLAPLPSDHFRQGASRPENAGRPIGDALHTPTTSWQVTGYQVLEADGQYKPPSGSEIVVVELTKTRRARTEAEQLTRMDHPVASLVVAGENRTDIELLEGEPTTLQLVTQPGDPVVLRITESGLTQELDLRTGTIEDPVEVLYRESILVRPTEPTPPFPATANKPGWVDCEDLIFDIHTAGLIAPITDETVPAANHDRAWLAIKLHGIPDLGSGRSSEPLRLRLPDGTVLSAAIWLDGSTMQWWFDVPADFTRGVLIIEPSRGQKPDAVCAYLPGSKEMPIHVPAG